MRRWAARILAVGSLLLALWIIVPAPTYFLLTFGVGAREVSAWIVVVSLVAIRLAVSRRLASKDSVAVIAGGLAAVLALSPFARLPGAVVRFDAAMSKLSATPVVMLRRKPISVLNLFDGIPERDAQITRDVPFASPGGTRLALDIYQPTTTGLHPIIVQIYGGAWQRGKPADNGNFAKWIAGAGYVVFAIDYRHAPAARWPVQLDDVDSSLIWIRDHAGQYGGDTSRVILMGRSAGAHLALMAAYSAPQPVTIRGVISYYGPADLVESYRHPPRPDPLDVRANEEALLGGTLAQMPERYLAASPISLATHPLPPTLLIYGGEDHIVEAKYGKALAARLAATGTSVAYLEIPWAEHAFDAVFNGPSSQLALYYTERFLAARTVKAP